MNAKRITRRLTKVALYILGSLVVLLVAFHLWFESHAKGLIEDLVNEQSNGKLHLKIKKFNFNWFNRKMELHDAVFYSTDTTVANTSYGFKIARLKIQVKQILPVIMEKKFYIDSIHVLNPEITVSRLRSPTDTTASGDSSLSIPQEMGRIYHSIQDALQVLKVDRFQIDNGTFSLINKTRPEEKPIVISRLFFHLDNLQVVDTTESDSKNKILFSDDVSLHTTNQDILFPDGRHRLSFSNFRINIRNKLAEFDSCTIIATKGDSSNTSFRIFFDKLMMTNIDFDTLYHTEVIKADSVYCINPRFRLDVDLPKRTGPVQPPKLDELIQQLTGNMQLAFVIVQNGSFDINTMREGRPSSFTSNNNNFELQGLRILENAPRPLTVERFAMAIRNYENFLRDSAFAIQFDSILLNNSRISLSNFSYKELNKNSKVVNSLQIPQFELQRLSWDNLIFEQQLNAEQVTLYRPVINYNLANRKNKTSKDVFQVLSSVGNVFQLNNLNIRDGQVNLYLDKKISLKLEGATMSVSGKQLVDSRRLASVQRSINELDFKKGVLKTPAWTAQLENVHFNGKQNQLKAQSAHIVDPKLTLDARNVIINSMVLPDKQRLTSIKGIRWESADLKLLSIPGSGSGSTGGFKLEDISGGNTNITANTGDLKMSVQLKSIVADKIESGSGIPITITGFRANGNDFKLTKNGLETRIAGLSIADKQSSTLKNVYFNQQSGNDSIRLEIPSVTLIPDINELLKGHINVDGMKLVQPFVKINLSTTVSTGGDMANAKKGWQDIRLGSLVIQQPVIAYRNTKENGTTLLEWQGNTNPNMVELKNLRLDKDKPNSFAADQLRFTMDHCLYISNKGKKFDAGNGQLEAQINQLAFSKNDADAWDWEGNVANLAARNFVVDSIGKRDGTLSIEKAQLNDLSISSSLLLNMRELVSRNTRFNLKEVTGTYHDAADQYNWFNAGYDKRNKLLTVDSFTYRPTPERDEYIKAKGYQTDYMMAKTGAISIGPFDVERFTRDTILDLGVVTVNDLFLDSYRDKRIPRQTGVIIPLPANRLKGIGKHLLADTVNIKNTNIIYQEVNEKTGIAGKITVNRLNGTVTHLRNFDLGETDSLTIRVSGYLQDTMYATLQLRESYTDTLGGFLLTGQMGPADLTLLNPVLAPLANAELRSGKLDTMSMRVVGREYLAFGEMKMYYHDLKIRVKRSDNKRTLLTSLTTFLANTLIKNDNKNRTGTLFNIRWRDRSAINYLVKIALSGMTSSVGVKRNKKLIRKYEKEIRSKKLPPVVL